MIDHDQLRAFARRFETGSTPDERARVEQVRAVAELHARLADRDSEEKARRAALEDVLAMNARDRERERKQIDAVLRAVAEALGVDASRVLADDFARVEARTLAHMIAARHR
jgi:pyrroloquinoline quinone (PQQ) biosynthesis protein C